MKKQQQEIKALLKMNHNDWPSGLIVFKIMFFDQLSDEEIVIKWIFHNKPDDADTLMHTYRAIKKELFQ